MSTTELIDLIKQLPEDKKKEVETLVYALASESNIEILHSNTTTMGYVSRVISFNVQLV